jgi:MYXO-CTERM domain-containing protein
VSASCTLKEYGDGLTPMGHGCHALNGYEVWYEHWMAGCNGVRVQASGTFNLVPIGQDCPGAVQILQIPMPASQSLKDPEGDAETLRNYYVELRASGNVFDASLAPEVAVYAADDVPPTRMSRHTYILDMDPSTPKVDGLAAGKTFTDPGGGPSIKVDSLSATGATVTVTIPNGTGGATCIDGTMLAGSGPSTCAAPPGMPDAGADGAPDGAPPPPPSSDDAGVGGIPAPGGHDGGSPSGGIGASDGGSGPAGNDIGPAGTSGGCACDTAGAAGEAPGALSVALGLLAALGLARRRRIAHLSRALSAGGGCDTGGRVSSGATKITGFGKTRVSGTVTSWRL